APFKGAHRRRPARRRRGNRPPARPRSTDPSLAPRSRGGGRAPSRDYPLALGNDPAAWRRLLEAVLLGAAIPPGSHGPFHALRPRASLLHSGSGHCGFSLELSPLEIVTPASTVEPAPWLVSLRDGVLVTARHEARGLRDASFPRHRDSGGRAPGERGLA